MLNVKALEREVRKDFLSDPFFVQKLLLSGELHKSLESKLWFSNHSWGIPDVPIKISWSPVGFIARTDDRSIQINAGHEYFSDDMKERYYQIFGAAAHENSHRRYTNFQAMIEYAENMEEGKTAIPDGDDEDKERLKELLEKAPKSLAKIVFKLHNAIEDGRIEELFIRTDKNLLTLWEGLVKLREYTYSKHSPTYDELMVDVEEGMPVFLAIEQMLLTYGRFSRVSGLPESGEIPELLSKVFPLIDEFKIESNANARLKILTKITMLLSEQITEYLNEKADKNGQDNSDDSGDNSQSSQGGSQGKNSQNGSQKAPGSEGNSNDSEEGGEDTSNDSNQNGSSQDTSSGLDDSFNDQAVSSDVQDDQDNLSGTTELPDCNTAGDEDFGEPKQGPETDESPNLEELKEKIIQEEIERRAEEIIQKALEDLAAGRIQVERPPICELDKAEYRKVVRLHEMAIKKAVKLSTFKFEQAPYLAKNRYFGTRFNADKVATGNFKTFSKVIRPPEKSGLRVVLNIDESGSMYGERIHYARFAAVIVYEYCKRMEIPIDIIGFDTEIRNFVDSSFPSEKDGPRLLHLEARGGTIDDIPLEIARQKLNAHPEAKKLILVISDGEGNGESTRAVAEACLKDRISILTAAIGDDKKTLESIYGRDSFMDIKDLSLLPQVLVKKIKNMLY